MSSYPRVPFRAHHCTGHLPCFLSSITARFHFMFIVSLPRTVSKDALLLLGPLPALSSLSLHLSTHLIVALLCLCSSRLPARLCAPPSAIASHSRSWAHVLAPSLPARTISKLSGTWNFPVHDHSLHRRVGLCLLQSSFLSICASVHFERPGMG